MGHLKTKTQTSLAVSQAYFFYKADSKDFYPLIGLVNYYLMYQLQHKGKWNLILMLAPWWTEGQGVGFE
jgi:hypothetical protein